MIQITALYRNIFRFLADEEVSFYGADELDAGGPDFMLLLLGIFTAVCILTGIVIGYKEWRRRRLCNPRKDYYRHGR